MAIAALPFAVTAAGGPPSGLALALTVQAAAMALMLLPAGVLGDRRNRRSLAVAADLLRCVARAGIAVLLLTGQVQLSELLAAQALNGIGTAVFSVTMDGLVPEAIAGEGALQRANSLRGLTLALGMTLGPALGGLLYLAGGAGQVLALDAASFAASAALLIGLARPFAVPATARGTGIVGALAELREGWQAFRGIRWYWRIAIQFTILNTLVLAPWFVIGPYVSEQNLGGAGAWATILASLGAGQLLGAALAFYWRPPVPLLTGTCLAATWLLPLVALAVAAPVPVIALGALLGGASLSLFEAIWETVKQHHTPPHLRARLGSFDFVGSLGLVPLGYMLGGAMIVAVGARPALLGAAAVLLAVTLSIVGEPSVRRPGASGAPQPPIRQQGKPAPNTVDHRTITRIADRPPGYQIALFEVEDGAEAATGLLPRSPASTRS